MRYHDTHFHLDLMPEPEKIADQIEQQQIYTIAVTNSPSVFFFTEKIASNKMFIRPALGLHPELAAERYNEVDHFVRLIDRTRYIGEIGLDNSNKTPGDYYKQKMVFEKMISACADAGDKILTIHSRKAANDVLDILGDNFPGKVILHWYSDPLKYLKVAIDRGYYFSVNYEMLESKNGKKIVDHIPIERILIETDGPFTKFNNKVCTPTMVEVIIERLRIVKSNSMSFEQFRHVIGNNFYHMLQTTDYNNRHKT